MSTKTRLSFKAFNEKETEKLLSNKPFLKTNFQKVRLVQWYNKIKNSLMYGIEIKLDNGKWFNVYEGNRALIFDDKKLANKVCLAMKKEIA